MNEFTEQFLIEARELAEQASADLLLLEERPDNAKALEEAFRAFHTLKGAAGIMAYGAMEQLLHRAEDLLQDVRSKQRAVDASLIDGLLACIGQLHRWFDVIERTEEMPSDAAREAARILVRFGEASTADYAKEPSQSLSAQSNALLPDDARAILEEQLRFLRLEADPSADFGRLGAAASAARNVVTACGLDAEAIERAAGSREALIAATQSLLDGPGKAPQTEADAGSPRDAATTIRVDIERIDEVVALAGELLVVKNALGHWVKVADGGASGSALASGLKVQQDLLERHLAALQRAVFDMRVLPLERVFGRFPRLVRETAANLGKQVDFSTEGGGTKADKAIVEALFEPLLHIIRNAIDHGVEPVDARKQAGKPPAASLQLRAWRDGDQVIVEVSDDGRGVDAGLVRRLAMERGLASAEAVAAMSDDQAVELIFAPGFSTSDAVTDLSGRGVGMGAVRSAIERVGGEAILFNHPGEGLVVRLVLPFSIMLTRIMTVEVGNQTFGVPFDAIIETVRVRRDLIRPIAGGRAFVLREETIPVINLADTLGLPRTGDASQACILVAWAGGIRAGLEIDRPGDRMDMMLKPAEGILSGMPAVAGASLTGDGQVLIVLDLRALIV